MSETASGPGLPIPADVIPRLTAAAARTAATNQQVNLADVAAVATTQAKALQLLGGGKVPGSEHLPVYVIT